MPKAPGQFPENEAHEEGGDVHNLGVASPPERDPELVHILAQQSLPPLLGTPLVPFLSLVQLVLPPPLQRHLPRLAQTDIAREGAQDGDVERAGRLGGCGGARGRGGRGRGGVGEGAGGGTVRVCGAEERERGRRACDEEVDEEGLRQECVVRIEHAKRSEKGMARTSLVVVESSAFCKSQTSHASGPMSRPRRAKSTAYGEHHQ